jgi:hypothetical protein
VLVQLLSCWLYAAQTLPAAALQKLLCSSLQLHTVLQLLLLLLLCPA